MFPEKTAFANGSALSSFLTLPGDVIIHRDRSENVETITRMLKRDSYNKMFLCGGQAMIDNLNPFRVANGFDQIMVVKDFPNPASAAVWGVRDEDLFAGAIRQIRTASQTNKPFFAPS